MRTTKIEEKHMKNVICLVCDGLPYDMTVDLSQHSSPMSFLSKFRERTINCTKAFSHGPYTEAGIMGLMYGINPLDNGTYLAGMQQWDGSLYKNFYDAGYEVFTSYFGSFTPPELMKTGKYVYYGNYFTPNFSKYIRGKLDYYRPIYKDNAFKIQDYIAIQNLLERHFESMLLWHCQEADENDSLVGFSPCENADEKREGIVSEWKSKVVFENKKFKSNPSEYICSIFNNYESHFITNECNVAALPLNKENILQRQYIKKEFRDIFSKIKKINKKTFIKNKQFPLTEILKTVNDRHKLFEYLYRSWNCFSEFDTSKMLDTNMDQLCTSSRVYVRSLIKWIKSRKSNKLFFHTYILMNSIDLFRFIRTIFLIVS